MPDMTMRDRMLALVQGRAHDRVPFVMYDGILPVEDVAATLGPERVGRLKWSAVHRVEHPHCYFESETYQVEGAPWLRNTLQDLDLGIALQNNSNALTNDTFMQGVDNPTTGIGLTFVGFNF